VIITLSEPSAGFLQQPLADLPIIPEHIWADVDNPDDLTEVLPVGSGPYELVEYVPESVWRFQAYPDYFRGAPSVDEIVMPFIADPSAAFLAVRSGEADATSDSLTPELVAEFDNAEDVATIGGTGFQGWYLYTNTDRAPFGEQDFRQAILSTLDVNEIVETALLGVGTAGSPGFAHRELPWANPATVEQRQDLDRARTLLDDLGFDDSDGDGVRETDEGEPLSYDLIVDSNDAVALRAVELISGWAAEVGIAFNPTALDPETAGSRIWPDEPVGQFEGDYFIGNHSWASIVQLDPSFLVNLFHSDPSVGTINRAGYDNPEYDRLAEELRRTTDEEAREEILFDLQAILAEDVPAIALYFPENIFPYRPEAFDQWVYYEGVGILNKATFVGG
jgi:peptide/nickel transport system substrate-binding protein